VVTALGGSLVFHEKLVRFTLSAISKILSIEGIRLSVVATTFDRAGRFIEGVRNIFMSSIL